MKYKGVTISRRKYKPGPYAERFGNGIEYHVLTPKGGIRTIKSSLAEAKKWIDRARILA